MKRGLKSLSGVGTLAAIGVEGTSPMKRGLKLHRAVKSLGVPALKGLPR